MEPTATTDLTTTKNSRATFNIKPTLVNTKKLVNELMAYVDDNKLAINIAGKKYLQVEAWQFTGSQLSLTAIVTDIEDVTPVDGKPKYKATVEVIHNPTGQLVSRGFALCSQTESKKSGFDEYAVASMAQTRAIGKAYRNILAWLPKLAGYEGTPAEEINDNLKEDMLADMNKVKLSVFSRFKELGITDSEKMLNIIEKAVGKRTIENVDDAMAVLAELSKED
jgi:hypothetical protein